MSKREQRLALAVGVLLLLVGFSKGFDAYQTEVELSRSEQQTAEQTLSTARAAVERGARARHRLDQWRKQSLPANVDIAKSLYQDCLHKQLTEAGLQVKQLREASSRARRNTRFEQLTFTITADGSLEALVKFLYQFYSSNHLHRISAASLTPSTDRKSLAIELTIDALALPGCKRTDRLADSSKSRLPRELDDYRNSIQSRNIFAAYAPGAAEDKPTGESNQATNARLTGMTYGQGGWRLAVSVQDSGKTLYFREGDAIHFGELEGTIASVDGDSRQVVVQTSEGMRKIKLGQNFGEAEKL